MPTYFYIFACCLLLAASTASGAEKLLYKLDTIPPVVNHNNAKTAIVSTDRGKAMEVDFGIADWPNIFI